MQQGTSQTPGSFTGSIKIDTSIDAPTEVHAFMAQGDNSTYAWYPNGFDFEVIPNPNDKVQPELKTLTRGNTIYFQVENKEFDGHTLSFKIEPKKSHYSRTHHEITSLNHNNIEGLDEFIQ